MSRGQQGQVFNQTTGQSNQAFGAAENDYTLANQDVGNFQAQLSKLGAENPYQLGGQFQNEQNQVLANTADASAQGAGARLQNLSQRTGQNPAAAINATEAMQQTNERNLAGQQAQAGQERIQGLTNYNQKLAGMYGEVPGMETGIAKGQGDLYSGALSTEEQAAKQPSFLETLEGQLAQAGDSFLQGYGQSVGKNAGSGN